MALSLIGVLRVSVADIKPRFREYSDLGSTPETPSETPKDADGPKLLLINP